MSRNMSVKTSEQIQKVIDVFNELQENDKAIIGRFTTDPSIVSDPAFIKLSFDEDSVNPQFNLHFYNDQDIPCRLTSKQATMFLTICVSMDWNSAVLGKQLWNGIDVPKSLGINANSEYADFGTMIRRFFPKNLSYQVVSNDFVRNMIKPSASGWNHTMRNFLGSKACEKICYFSTKKSYEKVNFEMPDQDPEFLELENEKLYHKNLQERHFKTSTLVDRAIINQMTAKDMVEQFGYKFKQQLYDVNTSFYDENAFRLAKLLVPNWWAALEEIIKNVVPGSQKNMTAMSDEIQNPLCKTIEYKYNAVQNFNGFLIETGLANSHRELSPREVYARLWVYVDAINDIGAANHLTLFSPDGMCGDVNETIEQLKVFYYSRCNELNDLLANDPKIKAWCCYYFDGAGNRDWLDFVDKKSAAMTQFWKLQSASAFVDDCENDSESLVF